MAQSTNNNGKTKTNNTVVISTRVSARLGEITKEAASRLGYRNPSNLLEHALRDFLAKNDVKSDSIS